MRGKTVDLMYIPGYSECRNMHRTGGAFIRCHLHVVLAIRAYGPNQRIPFGLHTNGKRPQYNVRFSQALMRFDKSSHLNANFFVLVAYGQLHPFARSWAHTSFDLYGLSHISLVIFSVFGHGFRPLYFFHVRSILFFFSFFWNELVGCNLAIRIFGQPFSVFVGLTRMRYGGRRCFIG